MKKNMLALSFLMISGAVCSLKAPVYMSPYMEADRILWDAVRGKKVNGFDFDAKPSFHSLTSKQINAYFAARRQAATDLFAHPEKYLTVVQLEAYNVAMAKAKIEVAAQEKAWAWEEAFMKEHPEDRGWFMNK